MENEALEVEVVLSPQIRVLERDNTESTDAVITEGTYCIIAYIYKYIH